MAKVREVAMQRAREHLTGTSPQSEDTTSTAEKTSQQMKAYKEAKEVANELSGADETRKDLQQKEAELVRVRDELTRERQQQLEKQIQDLGQQIAKLGAKDDGRVKELEHKLEQTRLELETEKFNQLRDQITTLEQKLGTAPAQDLSKEIQKVKDLAKELGLASSPTTGLPAETTIELKKMDINLQIQLAEMQDERDRRDKEWQLTLKKWEDEREARAAEVQGMLKLKHEQNEMVKGGLQWLGRTVARATMEAEGIPETTETGQTISSQVIEAGIGEFGKIECPKCKGIIPVAKDATQAICANCGIVYPIKRTAVKSPKTQEPELEEEVEPEVESLD